MTRSDDLLVGVGSAVLGAVAMVYIISKHPLTNGQLLVMGTGSGALLYAGYSFTKSLY